MPTRFDLPAFDAPLGLALVAAYLLGAVPFGWLMAKALRGVDLRSIGSGNIGATNAMRVLGRPLGLVAFLLDFAKGLVPAALFAGWAAPESSGAAVLCGAAAVLGHVFPVYLGFKGGKAVATGCGAVAGIDWVVFVVAGLAWPLALAATRYVSVASLALGAALPLAAWWRASGGRYGFEVVLFCGALFALILVRHAPNLRRLREGTESRIGRKRAEVEAG